MSTNFEEIRCSIAKELEIVQKKMNVCRMNVLLKRAVKVKLSKEHTELVEWLNKEINSKVKRQTLIEDTFEYLECFLDKTDAVDGN